MLNTRPLRPPADDSPSGIAQAVDSDTEALCMPCIDDDDIVDPKHALFGSPIVGVEHAVMDEHGAGARDAQPLPAPKGVTAAA